MGAASFGLLKRNVKLSPGRPSYELAEQDPELEYDLISAHSQRLDAKVIAKSSSSRLIA